MARMTCITSKSFRRVIGLTALMLACAVTFETRAAGIVKKEAEITWTITNPTIMGAPGETINLKLKADIPKGWHTYSTKKFEEDGPYPTSISVGPDTFLKINGEITATNIKTIAPNTPENQFTVAFEEIEESGTFTVPVTIAADAKAGDQQAKLTVKSQLCSDKKCLMPDKKELTFTLTVTEKGGAAQVEKPKEDAVKPKHDTAIPLTPPNIQPPKPPVNAVDAAQKSGLLAYFFLAMGAGLIALATPCVFPMIPITVSFFTKRMNSTPLRAILDAAVFAIGIVGTFTGLGFMFALLFGAASISKLVANGYFNLAFTGLMVAFALNLFGVFEIQVPSFVLNRLNKTASSGAGFGSVLVMGLLFSLTSFTCTGPFVGQTLVAAAKGNWLWPMFGMLGFSAAFAAPFVLLALFPMFIKKLPKAGGWLNSVKVVFGFLELALATKYLTSADQVFEWGFFTREVNLSIWIAVAALTTAYLLGWFQLTHDTPVEKIGGVRVTFASCFLATGVWMLTGLAGKDLGFLDSLLPPPPDTVAWFEDLEKARAEAKRTNKPMFVDFTGHSCNNCRLMERTTFVNQEVAGLLTKFVRVRLFTDGQKDTADIELSERNQQLEESRFSTTALPFYAIISADDKDVKQFADGMTYDAKKFADFLSDALSAAAAADAKDASDRAPVASK